MNQLDAMKLIIKCFNAGVVPMGVDVPGVAGIHFDMNRVLAGLDPREARKMKRKFRKLWRGIVRKGLARGGGGGMYLGARTGWGSEHPTRYNRQERKRIVQRCLNLRDVEVHNS